MYAGGLLATLLILGIILFVTLLVAVISEPRDVKAPRTREDPSDITRRLRSQGTRGRGRVGGSHGARG